MDRRASVKINNRRIPLFIEMIEGILPLSYQVDIVSTPGSIWTSYEIPCETDNQKRTIQSIEKILKSRI